MIWAFILPAVLCFGLHFHHTGDDKKAAAVVAQSVYAHPLTRAEFNELPKVP